MNSVLHSGRQVGMPSGDSIKTRETVASREGQTCILREKILVFPCKLESAISDSWGVRLGLRAIQAEGFIYPSEPSLDVSVAWGWGHIGDRVWSGGQAGGWTLYFDEDLFQSLEQAASEACTLSPMDRWRRLADHINEWRSPGREG